jgi:hypothetical protein
VELKEATKVHGTTSDHKKLNKFELDCQLYILAAQPEPRKVPSNTVLSHPAFKFV